FTARFQPASTHEVPHGQHVATTASGPAPTVTSHQCSRRVSPWSWPSAWRLQSPWSPMHAVREIRKGRGARVAQIPRRGGEYTEDPLSRRWAENRSAGGDSPDRLQRLSRACSFQKVTTRARARLEKPSRHPAAWS